MLGKTCMCQRLYRVYKKVFTLVANKLVQPKRKLYGFRVDCQE